MVDDAYIRPAQRDYSFSGEGSTGYSVGMGGSLRAGGPSATYNFSLGVHSMDSESFIQWVKNNPTSAGQVLMTGLTDSGVSAVQSQIAWNASNNGFIPAGGLIG